MTSAKKLRKLYILLCYLKHSIYYRLENYLWKLRTTFSEELWDFEEVFGIKLQKWGDVRIFYQNFPREVFFSLAGYINYWNYHYCSDVCLMGQNVKISVSKKDLLFNSCFPTLKSKSAFDDVLNKNYNDKTFIGP